MLRAVPVLLAAGLLLAGCLPTDQRRLSRELFPADSLSRALAEATPADTLELVWRVEAPPEVRYPLSLAWGEGRIVVADAHRNRHVLHAFAEDGAYLGAFADPALTFPFVAGLRGDTIAVVSRGQHRLHLVAWPRGGTARIVRSLDLPEGRNAVAAWTPAGLMTKTTTETGAALARLDGGTYPLPGPPWRHIGFLRVWGDTLVSLSGYRPVVDVLPLRAAPGTPADTLALVGFDSPQLHRSRLFVLGEVNEPPLLTPSAAPAGPYLFVLNARPGWVHLDAFARTADGLRLRHTLLEPRPEVNRNFFAADVAARRDGAAYEFVVLVPRPRPALVRYRWVPPAD